MEDVPKEISDNLSSAAVSAFVVSIAVGLRDADGRTPETRTSKAFLQVVLAALENVVLHSPDLHAQEWNQIHRLYREFESALKDPDLPEYKDLT